LIWDLTHIPKNKIKKNTFGGYEVGVDPSRAPQSARARVRGP